MSAVVLQSADVPYIIFVVVGILIFILFAHFLPWDEDYMESDSKPSNEAQDNPSQQ